MDEPIALAGLPRFDPNPTPEGVGSGELGKDAFLKLLTTQLQNQDPTNPVQNEEFAAQLAQFSSLEQLIGMQESLDAVYGGIAAMNNASMSSLLGRHVVAVGDTFTLPDTGGAELHFEAAGPYEGATLTVFDEDGSVVASADLPAGESGESSWSWDGTDLDGDALPPGQYSFEITGVGDQPPEFRELVVGEVDEMDYASGLPQPSVNGAVVSLDAILRLTSGG